MLRTLTLAFLSVCLWMVGHTASVHAAIHTQARNSQFNGVLQEWLPVRSADTERRGIVLELPPPFSAHTEDATKDSQERCLWDVAVAAGCQPPPGSPFSAFPLVFSPDLLHR
jgi:hypothetical protein